jgi:hypothetical protein
MPLPTLLSCPNRLLRSATSLSCMTSKMASIAMLPMSSAWSSAAT